MAASNRTSDPEVLRGNPSDARINEINSRLDLAKKARFQEQCFLMFYKKKIVDLLSSQRRTVVPGPTGGAALDFKKAYTEGVFDYDHIVAIHAQEGELLASQLQSVDGAKAFFNLDSAILSQLKPTFELYKIYPKIKTSKDHPGVPLRVAMPLGEVEDRAEGGLTQDQLGGSKLSSYASIDELFRLRGGFNEWGGGFLGMAQPSNISIEFGGKDPAQVNIIDSFQFTLYFSSFQLFNHVFKGQHIDPTTKKPSAIYWSYKDLISWSENFLFENNAKTPGTPISTVKKISDTDLIGTEPCIDKPDTLEGKIKETAPLVNNAQYFEIQAIIRYDDQVNFDIVDKIQHANTTKLTTIEREEIKNFLRSSALVTRLQFLDHEISYTSAGVSNPGLTVKFNYAAYLDGILRSPDLNIVEIPTAEQKKLAAYMHNLAMAEKLLIQVKARELTLKSSLNPGGPDSVNETAIAYSTLRKQLGAKGGAWMINLPHPDDSTRTPYGQIVVTKEEVMEAQRAGRIKQEREGLKRNPSKLRPGALELGTDGRPINNKANAVKVFEELIKKYNRYIQQRRRAERSKRYNWFFEQLWAKGRIYKALALPEEIGLTSGGEVADNQEETAEWRQGELEAPRNRQWNVLKVTLVKPSTTEDPASKMVDKFTELMENATEDDMDSNKVIKKGLMEVLTKKGEALDPLGPKLEEAGGKKAKPIYFTTLGDVVDTAIDMATWKAGSGNKTSGGTGLFNRRMGILFGPLIDHNAGASNDKQEQINLAQVPISLKTMMSFWVEYIVQRDREEYLLGQFITDLITKLVTRALGEKCVEDGGTREESVKLLHFTSEMKKGGEGDQELIPPFYPKEQELNRTPPNPDMSEYPNGGASNVKLFSNGRAVDFNDDPIKYNNGTIDFTTMTNVSPNTPLEEQFNYMLVFVHNYIPSKLIAAERDKNIMKGIYYIEPGRMPSVIRSINFSRKAMPWLREARLSGVSTVTGGLALRDVYDAVITMYGNNIFKPGMLIFIDPTREGGTDYGQWKELGIGGFYVVTGVNHQILSGDVLHSTIVRAKWVTFGSCGDASTGAAAGLKGKLQKKDSPADIVEKPGARTS